METSLNEVRLQGYLRNDPDITELPNGNRVARASIATTEKFKKDGEWIEITIWHQLAFWNKQAYFAELNLKKGLLVYVFGKLANSQYTDKDGITRYFTEIKVVSARTVDNRKLGE